MKNSILFTTTSFFLTAILLGASAPAKEKAQKAAKAPKTSTVSMADVRSVVKEKMPEVQRCYTDLIIEGMATSGKITVTWDIDDKGVVQNLALKDPKPEQQALSGCVTEKLGTWTFPPAEAEKTFPVTYTFNFGS